jgi:hypothetical protein
MSLQEEKSKIQEAIDEFYDVISGSKEEQRDWDKFRSLFFSGDSALASIKFNEGKELTTKPLNVNAYITGLNNFLSAHDFYEYGLNYEICIFGSIAHVYSEYEAKRKKEDPCIIKKGVNLVQLIHDGHAWKIYSMLWQDK